MGYLSIVVLVLNIKADGLVMPHRLIGLIVLSRPPICMAVLVFFSPDTQDRLSGHLRDVSPILNPFSIFLQQSLQPLSLEFDRLLNALVQVMLANCQQTIPHPLFVETTQCIIEELSLFGFKLLLKSSIGWRYDDFFINTPQPLVLVTLGSLAVVVLPVGQGLHKLFIFFLLFFYLSLPSLESLVNICRMSCRKRVNHRVFQAFVVDSHRQCQCWCTTSKKRCLASLHVTQMTIAPAQRNV